MHRSPWCSSLLALGRSLVAAWLLGFLAVATGCSGPEAPALASAPVKFVYTSPDPATLPPPTPDLAAMCYHHNAPSNLQVTTSWGATGRFEWVEGRVYSLSFEAVPTNTELWLAFIDITLCPTPSVWVTSGLTANGVTLARTSTIDNRPVLQFRLDSAGKVVP
jgi:hypothetical protein